MYKKCIHIYTLFFEKKIKILSTNWKLFLQCVDTTVSQVQGYLEFQFEFFKAELIIFNLYACSNFV